MLEALDGFEAPNELMIYDSILGTIGRTPIVRIQRLAPDHVTMYVKCEFFNPLGSVKDRLAIAIIEDAEKTGALALGQTVVEATSGNTGIALAMVCAAKGYPFVATMAETFSIERRKRRRGQQDCRLLRQSVFLQEVRC
jgi:cysteine synthase